MSDDESFQTSQPYEIGSEHADAAPPDRPGRGRRVGRRTAVVTGVAIAVAAGGGAVALAASGSASPIPTSSASGSASPPGYAPSHAPGEGWPGGHGHGGPGMGPGGFERGPFGALHGELTVNTGTAASPTYSVRDVQTGTVSAVGGGSITVRSADGFTKTYALPAAAHIDHGHGIIGEIKTGDTVGLSASVSGGAAIVTELGDRTRDTRPGRPFGPDAPAPSSPVPTSAS